MTRDYSFVSDYCIVIVQDCDSSDTAKNRLVEIVKYPDRFRLDNIEGDEE